MVRQIPEHVLQGSKSADAPAPILAIGRGRMEHAPPIRRGPLKPVSVHVFLDDAPWVQKGERTVAQPFVNVP
jgi:hypothetical protein